MLPTVFLDVDNTIILADTGITKRMHSTLKKYIDAGGNIVLTTGKIPVSIYDLIKSLDYEDSYHMGGNGAVMFNLAKEDHKLLASVGKRAKDIVIDTLDHGLKPYVYFEDAIAAPYEDIVQDHSDHFVKIGEPKPHYQKVEDIDFDQVLKVLYYIDDTDLESENIVRRATHGINGVDVIRTTPFLLEVHDHNQTKANPAHVYCDMYGLDIKKDCIAVGDSENDLPLLQAVGKAYLVANAADDLKKHGFEVINSCAEDGVADLLEDILSKSLD